MTRQGKRLSPQWTRLHALLVLIVCDYHSCDVVLPVKRVTLWPCSPHSGDSFMWCCALPVSCEFLALSCAQGGQRSDIPSCGIWAEYCILQFVSRPHQHRIKNGCNFCPDSAPGWAHVTHLPQPHQHHPESSHQCEGRLSHLHVPLDLSSWRPRPPAFCTFPERWWAASW